MRRLERGASYVPLIIVLVLLVVAVVWAYVQTDKADNLTKQLDAAKQSAETANKARGAVMGYIRLLSESVGFPIAAGTEEMPTEYKIDRTAVSRFIAEKLDALRTKYVRKFPISVYTVDPNGGVKRSEPAEGMITVGYASTGEIPSETTLQNLYNLMDAAMGRMLNDITRLVGQLETRRVEFETQRTNFETEIRNKDAEITRRQNELAQLEAAKSASERELRDRNQTLENQKREAEETLATYQKEKSDEVAALKQELQQRDASIQKLKTRQRVREMPIGPDGSILAVTDDIGLAWIDRGRKDHLMPGTTFDVYMLGKGAVKVQKGTILVLDVEDTRAKVRVTSLMSPDRPIVAGDLIESVTYNPSEVQHFFLLGRTRKYGKADAKVRIQQLGQVVDDEVGIDTDYLVMGAPEGPDDNLRESDAYKRAQELGIRVITEEQLSQFLPY